MASINDNANLLKKKKIQYCAYCGAKLTEGTKFCSNCGKPVFATEENGKEVAPVNMTPEESDAQKEEIPNTKRNASNTIATQVVNGSTVKEASELNPSEEQPKEKKPVAKCPKCGAELVEGATFCHVCGTPLNQSSPKIQPKTEREKTYTGKVVKCPNCGEVLDAFVSICPSCGYELREVGNSSAVQEFAALVANTKNDREKINIIRNFPIPNTKEDILEFSILASTNINENQNLDDEVSDAWFAKLQQAYQKADLSFKDQPEFTRVENIYEQIKELREADKKSQKISKVTHPSQKTMRTVSCVILVVMLLICGVVFLVSRQIVNNRAVAQSIAESEEAAIKAAEERAEEIKSVYEWPTSGLSQYLPDPKADYGRIGTDSDEWFKMYIYQVPEQKYDEYVQDCKNHGFTLYEYVSGTNFYAYNEEEYYLKIRYNDELDQIYIELEAPMEMTEIHWPDTALVNQIPKPDSLLGNVKSETSNYFNVYLANITPEQFEDYVDKCMEQGFTKNYSRREGYFRGKNSKGNTLILESENFNKMELSIRK